MSEMTRVGPDGMYHTYRDGKPWRDDDSAVTDETLRGSFCPLCFPGGTEKLLDDLKQAIRDANSGKQPRQTGAPRPQWLKDTEASLEQSRQKAQRDLDEALGIDHTYHGHISKPRRKRVSL